MRALIIGVGGQDGSYLAELLLSKGYEVHGVHRRSSYDNLARLPDDVRAKITFHKGDLADPISIGQIISLVRPDELYNEADQDNVGWSHSVPSYNFDITFGAVGRLLELVRQIKPDTKVFQPCTAMMYEGAEECPQSTLTPPAPMSPYACAKTGAYYLCRYYRQKYDMKIYTGIMYNHDSPRRQGEYLLHEIARKVIDAQAELSGKIVLRNPDAYVDIGYAPEYMNVAWHIMQEKCPVDVVVGTGKRSCIEDIVRAAWTEAAKLFDCVEAPKLNLIGTHKKFTTPLIADTFWTDSRGITPATQACTIVRTLVNHYWE